jgi:hypothetical protein
MDKTFVHGVGTGLCVAVTIVCCAPVPEPINHGLPLALGALLILMALVRTESGSPGVRAVFAPGSTIERVREEQVLATGPVHRAAAELREKLGREPTVDEVVEHVEVLPRELVEKILSSSLLKAKEGR